MRTVYVRVKDEQLALYDEPVRPEDDDVEAVLHQLRSTRARAMALLKQEKAQREWLRERGVEV